MIYGVLSPDHLEVAFLTFCRIAGILVTAPIFQSQRVPIVVKVGLSALLAAVLFPIAGHPTPTSDLLLFTISAAREVFVGIGFGLVSNLLFAAVSVAGSVADLQSGFAFASLVDPTSEEETAIIARIQLMSAWLVFLVVNGHHLLLRGLSESFAIIPVGAAVLPSAGPAALVAMVSRTFVAAVQIGAPVMGSVLVADIALGLLARAVPQANLLSIGFPIKMLFAFATVLLSLPLLIAIERSLVTLMERFIGEYLQFMAVSP